MLVPVPAPPPGPPPDGPAQVILPPPAERPRRRWQFGREQTLEEQDEEYRRDHQEFLHLQGLLRDATERLEATDERISNASGNELTHFQGKRAELEIAVQDPTDEIEKVRCLKLELWTVNGRRHPLGWVPWGMRDHISPRGTGNMPRPFPCQHPDVVRRASQHAVWWCCHGAARTATARAASSSGVVTLLPGQYESSSRSPATNRSTSRTTRRNSSSWAQDVVEAWLEPIGTSTCTTGSRSN